MVLFDFLKKVLIFSLLFLLIGQLFGVCVLPETGGYGTHMSCISGEWKRKTSKFFRFLKSEAETSIEQETKFNETDRERMLNF